MIRYTLWRLQDFLFSCFLYLRELLMRPLWALLGVGLGIEIERLFGLSWYGGQLVVECGIIAVFVCILARERGYPNWPELIDIGRILMHTGAIVWLTYPLFAFWHDYFRTPEPEWMYLFYLLLGSTLWYGALLILGSRVSVLWAEFRASNTHSVTRLELTR